MIAQCVGTYHGFSAEPVYTLRCEFTEGKPQIVTRVEYDWSSYILLFWSLFFMNIRP